MTLIQPLVSVIMPAYNAEQYVEQAINSLLAQTYPHWELLVADDGSKDSTRSLLDSFNDPRIVRFHQSANQGYLKTWNHLLSKAKGDYITFLDADDYIHPNRLLLLVDYLNLHPGIDLCGTGMAVVTHDQKVISTRTYPAEWDEIQKKLYHPTNFPFCGSAVMVRRQVIEKVGGYRSFFDRAGWEDHDWLIRCCERFEAANIPEVLYYYRQTSASVTRSIEVSELSIRKLVIKKIGVDLALQRLRTGSDYLMEGNQAGLEARIAQYEKPYRLDPSRIYRIMCHRALQEGNKKVAISLAFQGIQKNPFHPSNYLGIFRILMGRMN